MMAGRGKYKTVQREGVVGGATDTADLSDLAEEMRSWFDNMSGTALEQTEKCGRVGEAADQLENAVSSLEIVDIPDAAQNLPVTYTEMQPRSRRRSPSRSSRLANITNLVEAAVTALEEWAEENKDEEGKAAASELTEVISELEGVEFPGMFG